VSRATLYDAAGEAVRLAAEGGVKGGVAGGSAPAKK
jgi:hypothetical protein